MNANQIQIGKTYHTTRGIVRIAKPARIGGWDATDVWETTNVVNGAKRRVTARQIRYQAFFIGVVMAQVAA